MTLKEAIQVSKVESLSARELDACDFTFDVTHELVAPYDDPLNVRWVSCRRKDYEFEPERWNSSSSDRHAIFVALRTSRVVGFAAISETWNGMAEIDEIAVDRQSRNLGIAGMLMAKAEEWAREQGFTFVRLETQANNPSACRTYTRAGYVLSGFDSKLYDGGPNEGEVALFWYRDLR